MRLGIKEIIGGGGISDDFNQAASGLFLPRGFDPDAPAKPAAPRRAEAPVAQAQTATKVTAPKFDFSKKKKKDG